MNSAARDAIFDLAINRAASFLRGAGQNAALELWHSKTRFASRVELELIRAALEQRPPVGEWFWDGGESGGWEMGKAPTP
jgi:hypothetical protein